MWPYKFSLNKGPIQPKEHANLDLSSRNMASGILRGDHAQRSTHGSEGLWPMLNTSTVAIADEGDGFWVQIH